MNIFVLDESPRLAAQAHLDKHVVKMVLEYAQLLSTAHRLIDGTCVELTKPDGKTQKLYVLDGERCSMLAKQQNGPNVQTAGFLRKNPYKFVIEQPKCYGATHVNHPCAVWTRESDGNYNWLYQLFKETAAEYSYRYGKQHKTFSELSSFLSRAPRKIAAGDLTPFPQAMGEEFKHDDPIQAYRNYYLGAKAQMARWTNRETPAWFKANTKDYNASTFERTLSVG